MSQIHFEIKDRQGIEALGFEYAENVANCHGHMFNAIPVEIDIRDKPEYSLEACEEDLNQIFKAVLQWELKEAGVKALHAVSWTRIFFITNWWDTRDFTARFWVRVVSEDVKDYHDGHTARA